MSTANYFDNTHYAIDQTTLNYYLENPLEELTVEVAQNNIKCDLAENWDILFYILTGVSLKDNNEDIYQKTEVIQKSIFGTDFVNFDRATDGFDKMALFYNTIDTVVKISDTLNQVDFIAKTKDLTLTDIQKNCVKEDNYKNKTLSQILHTMKNTFVNFKEFYQQAKTNHQAVIICL